MSKIEGIILPQNYEIVEAKVYDILKIELANQFALTGEEVLNSEVYLEKNIDPNQEEYPLISVKIGNIDDTNTASEGGQIVETTYYIDCYNSAKTTDLINGMSKSYLELIRLTGVIRSILLSPNYRNLGLKGIVRSRNIRSIQFSEQQGNNDSYNVSQARLVLVVKTIENSEQIQTQLIKEYFTSLKIDNSNKGYEWQGTSQHSLAGALDLILDEGLA